MAGVTWEATIRLPQNGDQVRVRVVAPTHFAARQMIELQYDEAQILFGTPGLALVFTISQPNKIGNRGKTPGGQGCALRSLTRSGRRGTSVSAAPSLAPR